MKKIFKWALMLPLIASVTLVSCSKEDDESIEPKITSPVDGKTLIYEATAADAEIDVKVYADEVLFVGYNRIYVLLYEVGTKNMIKNANVSFGTEMTMLVGMTHSSPIEDPETTDPSDGVFQGAAVFIMPSEGNGTWTFRVRVRNNANNYEGEVKSEVNIISPTQARMYSFLSATDSAKVFVSLVEPMKPEVGANKFEVVVHSKETMMLFPSMEDLNIEIEPEMPTMNHGSPNNVNPTHIGNGHYEGVVNYTMTGLWRVHMTVKDANGNVMDDANYFDMTF